MYFPNKFGTIYNGKNGIFIYFSNLFTYKIRLIAKNMVSLKTQNIPGPSGKWLPWFFSHEDRTVQGDGATRQQLIHCNAVADALLGRGCNSVTTGMVARASGSLLRGAPNYSGWCQCDEAGTHGTLWLPTIPGSSMQPSNQHRPKSQRDFLLACGFIFYHYLLVFHPLWSVFRDTPQSLSLFSLLCFPHSATVHRLPLYSAPSKTPWRLPP